MSPFSELCLFVPQGNSLCQLCAGGRGGGWGPADCSTSVMIRSPESCAHDVFDNDTQYRLRHSTFASLGSTEFCADAVPETAPRWLIKVALLEEDGLPGRPAGTACKSVAGTTKMLLFLLVSTQGICALHTSYTSYVVCCPLYC